MTWEEGPVTDLVMNHEFLARHRFGLIQRHKLDVLGRQGCVSKGSADTVEVVRAYRDEGSLAGEILMQLVLQSNEGFVS